MKQMLFVCVLISTLAFAQSSGNFNAMGTAAECAIGSDGSFSNGSTLAEFTTQVQTSNANGLMLLVRPSLVTGLFTQTKLSTTVTSATADIGLQVCLTVDGKSAGIYPKNCVVYDQRFQQISSGLFTMIQACVDDPTNPNCSFDLILSTLSAHSFDFVIPVGQGTHTVTATWNVIGAGALPNSDAAKVASCVGPGLVTVTQVKNFSQNGVPVWTAQ